MGNLKEDKVLKKIVSATATALVDAFKIQLGWPLKITDICLSSQRPIAFNCGAVIQFSGNPGLGQMRILFSEASLNTLFKKMVGEIEPVDFKERLMAGSEMLNIIYASARIEINSHGFQFNPAIPQAVSVKENKEIEKWPDAVTIFSGSPMGDILLEVALAKAG